MLELVLLVITYVFRLSCPCWMEIRNVCLHLGQNSGKLISMVSDRIMMRVFAWQLGQRTH